jgi:hypothetical protein
LSGPVSVMDLTFWIGFSDVEEGDPTKGQPLHDFERPTV